MGTMLLAYLALNPAIWEMVRLLRQGDGFWQAVDALVQVGDQATTIPFLQLFFFSAFPFLLILTGVFSAGWSRASSGRRRCWCRWASSPH